MELKYISSIMMMPPTDKHNGITVVEKQRKTHAHNIDYPLGQHNLLGISGLPAQFGISHYNNVAVAILEIESIEMAQTGCRASKHCILNNLCYLDNVIITYVNKQIERSTSVENVLYLR